MMMVCVSGGGGGRGGGVHACMGARLQAAGCKNNPVVLLLVLVVLVLDVGGVFGRLLGCMALGTPPADQ